MITEYRNVEVQNDEWLNDRLMLKIGIQKDKKGGHWSCYEKAKKLALAQ